ncbi:MAG: metal-dependent hydrolase, partial [Alphaproteobacteria bacterium]|nr:metal-dependent hydrolase [Alphaproteobacteria bacterium]
MDLVTQGLLGATVGYAVSGRDLGKKQALIYGGLFGLLPDMDILISYISHNPLAEAIHHRGITHSLFFAPFFAGIIGLIAKQYYKKEFLPWFKLAFWAIITHPLLDLFTTYGTQLLMPFSNNRFSLNAVPVVDFAYSIPLVVSIIYTSLSNKEYRSRICNNIILFLTSCYLILGIAQYDKAMERVLNDVSQKNWHGRAEVFTGIFSIFNRRAVVYEGDKVHIAHFNTLNQRPIQWTTFKQDPLPITSKHIEFFKWFSKGHMLVQKHENGYLLRDIRFGIFPHPVDGLWGIEIDHEGYYKDWEKFTDLK